MGIEIDRERCIGAAQCVLAAPDVFRQDEQGLSTLWPGPYDDELTLDIHEAADACPVRAITVP